MNMNQLKIFHTVAKLQGFTRASKELFLTQPGISKHIKQLEEYYGTPLFDRLGKKVVCTQAGEVLFEATKSILKLLDDAGITIDDLKGLMGGKLKVGASFTMGIYIISKILGDFSLNYPGIEIILDVSLSDQIAEGVLSNDIDIGFIGSLVDDERLVPEKFLEDELVVIVPHNHSWKTRKSIKLQELVDQPFIVSGHGSGTRIFVETQLKEMGITLKKKIVFGNTEAVKKAVVAGLGVSIISKFAIETEANSDLIKTIRLPDSNFNRTFYYIYRKDKYLTNAVKAFISLL
jgi:DNA-binding transcriptional LysR family regulator